MAMVCVALFFLQWNIPIYLAQQQVKTFFMVCEDASIDSTPFVELHNVEDASTCALSCVENDACNSFSYTFEMSGLCNFYRENLEEMKFVFSKNWAVFLIKSKTTTNR